MAKKRTGLLVNPLKSPADVVTSPSSQAEQTSVSNGDEPHEHAPADEQHPAASRKRKKRGAAKKNARERTRTSVILPTELLERARDAVYWLSGPPHRLTLTQLLEDALAKELKALEREHNDGSAFEQREGELRR